MASLVIRCISVNCAFTCRSVTVYNCLRSQPVPSMIIRQLNNYGRSRSAFDRSFSNWSRHSKPKSLPTFQTLHPLRTCIRKAHQDTSKFDPSRESRRQKLMFFTYISGFIGVCLLSAVGFRYYSRFSRRAKGIEDIYVREWGRRPLMFWYRGYLLPEFVVNDIKNMHPFEVREDDIWVVSFPKAGTTWVQEVVYLVNNDVDIEAASKANLEERFPYFEYIFPGKEAISRMPSPRLIKTHLPFSLLPNQMKTKKPKIIYVARNPKDTVVSFYFFAIKFLAWGQAFHGSFEDYCRLFVEDLVLYGPWWKHVKEGWERRDDDNVLVLFYEDLQRDLPKAVRDIATFLNKTITETQVEQIVQHCSFDNMKKNKTTNYDWMKDVGIAKGEENFMRKGKVGDWKNHLSKETIEKLDEVVATKLTPIGFPITDSFTVGS